MCEGIINNYVSFRQKLVTWVGYTLDYFSPGKKNSVSLMKMDGHFLNISALILYELLIKYLEQDFFLPV